jgi:ATP-dependent exoDNAse (exonuclease V) beta subunit
VPDFTAQQKNAIEYLRKDACVVAGPGSGKTTVLVERYCRLVEDLGFRLSEILAITFTEKAAANMKEKLAEKFQHNDVRLRDLDTAWVSTIHGFCARLLRENAIEAGIDPQFRVLDAREAEDLQAECVNAALDEMVAMRREETLALIEALQTPFYLAKELTDAYEAIRSAGRSIADVRAMPNPAGDLTPLSVAARLTTALDAWPYKLSPLQRTQRAELYDLARSLSLGDDANVPVKPMNWQRVPQDAKEALKEVEPYFGLLRAKAADRDMAPLRDFIFDVLQRFDEIYRERKAAIPALDFTNLEERAIEMLRRPETRDRVRGMFRQIMLDEYQDVNERQAELVRLIRGEDVFFAVGDVNQSIYGFRHARPEIFHRYRAEVAESGKHAAELLHNFRSREAILRAVEALLNESEGIERRDLVAGRAFAEAEGPFVEIIRASGQDEDEARAREARWIAHRILSLGNEFRDFAVLCRTGEAMKPILAEFQNAGIPYVCGRRESFLSSREGCDITALLHVVENPRDGIALATALRSPLVGVSDEALLRLRLLRGSVIGGMNAAAFDRELLADFDEPDAQRIESFAKALRRWRADAGVVPLDVLIGRMLSDCGYAWTPGDTAGDNVEAYLHLARTRGTGRPLKKFLRELESIEAALDAESELSDKDQGNRVQVMTAHAAKGLEFPITIIAGMDRGTRRETAAVAFTPEHGLGLRWKGPEKDGLIDSWAQKNAERFRQREREEENRLLYVAMTRAEERLILSYSRGSRQGWGRKVDDAFVKSEPPVPVRVWEADADPPAITAGAHRHTGDEAVAVVPRPAVSEQYDTAVNVTALSAFAQCPRRYYIERYVGWSGGPGKRGATKADPDEIPAAEMGTHVHEILAGTPGQYAEDALALAAVFERSELARRAAAASRCEREWDFISEIDGVLVRGSIDLWFEDEQGVHVVDYKTDATVRASEHAPQLALYAVALEKALGKRPVSAALHYLRADRVESVEIDEEATGRARAIIGKLRTAQETLSFPLNAGEHCRACRCYRSMCSGVDDKAEAAAE